METSLRARVRAGDPDAFGQLFDSALLDVAVTDDRGKVTAVGAS
ncbi:hypothetical protein [Streptomyces rugosispiralis]|uniref:GNAT family N-acetyltransferase n=1 Tax=Streptomyces rugosispiralis TaxID=2967341 RepID=A0ABT1V111_9ACTN|nr:hypothetical protein [Streptomyces rugosispiralis]MCQ8191073.1 hypothetical protein [Streptomyces rugosispiralis]